MRVEVGLLEEAREIAIDPGVGWAVEAAASALEGVVRDLRGALVLSREGKRVHVEGELACDAELACDRCGEPVVVRLREAVDLVYAESESATEAERELAADDLDLGWYEDGVLSVADVVGEALALARPARITCEDEAGCDARTRAMLEDQPRAPTAFEAALAGWGKLG